MKISSIPHEKRAVTEMVAYVAMIIVAFSISIIIYTYLQVQTPKDRPECPEGVALIVSDATCKLIFKKNIPPISTLDITLENKGRNSIDGAYVRMGAKDQEVKNLLNDDKIFFTNVATAEGKYELPPGHSISQSYRDTLSISRSGTYSIEVQPVIGTPGNLALCEKAITIKIVQCEYPLLPGGVPAFVSGTYEYPLVENIPNLATLYRYDQVKTSITPSSTISDYVDNFEASLYRKEGTIWSLVETRQSETREGSAYSIQFGGLQSLSTYKIESFLYVYNGNKLEKVPVSSGGSTSRAFTIPRIKYTLDEFSYPGVILKNYPDGSRTVGYYDRCNGNTWIDFFRLYTNVYEPVLDSFVVSFNQNSCSLFGQGTTCRTENTIIDGVTYSVGKCVSAQ